MHVLDYIKNVFAKFADLKPITITIIIVLIGAFVAYILLPKKEAKKYNTRVIVYAGLCIAVSFVLSYLRLYRWPQGGSITPASMLPLFVFAYFFGARAGIIAGIAFGFLHLIQGAFIVHWTQILLDYILAYGALGIAGYFRKNLHVGILVGGFGRFLFSFLSGVIFFGEYAPEGMNVILYSILVNLLIIGTETLICLAVSLIPQVKTTLEKLKMNV